MSPAEIVAKCDEQMTAAGPGTIVTLVLGGRSRPKGDRMRLLPRAGPIGRLYAETEAGFVVGFPARELKAFAQKQISGA